MRKIISLALVCALFVGVILVVGCGSKEQTVKIGDEEVTVTEEGEGGDVTVESEEGEATYSSEVSEEDLGAPIYPDAELDKDASASVETTSQDGEGTWTAATFLTGDSVSEVVAWYRDKLSGEQNFMDMSYSAEGEEMGMFTFGSAEETTSVTISADDMEEGKTAIVIMTGTGSETGQ